MGVIQEAIRINRKINRFQKTWDDVEEYAKHTPAYTKLVIGLNCPECAERMHLIEVNTKAKNQIGGTSKSMWWCPNPECNHTLCSDFSVQEEAQRVRRR